MYSTLPPSSKKARRNTLNSLWHQVGNAVDTGKHRSRRRRGPCTPLYTVDEDWEEVDEPDAPTTPTSTSDDTTSSECSATSSSASSSSTSPSISTIPLATPPNPPPRHSTRASLLNADVDKPLPEYPAPQPRPRRVNTYDASRRYGMYGVPLMDAVQEEQEVEPRRRHRRHASEGDVHDLTGQFATARVAHKLVVSIREQ